jgi:hypothetical protein
MDTTTPPPKKGIGALGWLGIGCGGLVLIVVIVCVVFAVKMGPAAKKFAAEAQSNPTRATANMAVTVSAGKLEMAAEDDINKRYTLREKGTDKLTTIYWDAKQQKPLTVSGDFSAIPADATAPATPAPPQ